MLLHETDSVKFQTHLLSEYGGLGLDYRYSVAMAEAMGNIHCGGIPMAVAVQTDMSTPALARYYILCIHIKLFVLFFGVAYK